jgi:glutamate synthase domain-containing protein 2
VERKKNLSHQLHVLQNRSAIKQYAQNNLGMKKIKLEQIKQIPI